MYQDLYDELGGLSHSGAQADDDVDSTTARQPHVKEASSGGLPVEGPWYRYDSTDMYNLD